MITGYTYRSLQYFLYTFVATFLLWFAGAWLSHHEEGAGLYMLLMLPGLMAPFLISLGFVFFSGNKEMKKDFLNRTFNPSLVNVRNLWFLLFIMPVVVLISIFISVIFGGSADQFKLSEEFSFSTGFVPVLLLLLLAASFEELGWRGYAFDSLQSHFSFLHASVIFSVLWSFWHMPLLFVKDSYQYEIYNDNIWFAVNFFVSIIPLGIIISWVCIKNNKSVLAAILFHFIINLSQEVLSMTQETKCIETVVLCFVVVLLVKIDRETFFNTTESRFNPSSVLKNVFERIGTRQKSTKKRSL